MFMNNIKKMNFMFTILATNEDCYNDSDDEDVDADKRYMLLTKIHF
jgi:hypothetical protein